MHNAWMNDVESWMSDECFGQYERLIEKANQLDCNKAAGKLGATTKKGVGKRKGSVGMDSKGVNKGSTGKSAEPRKFGPRQQAQQLKKTRFNKVVSDLAAKKAFFMSFVRHPFLMSANGIMNLLVELREVMQTADYAEMLRVSASGITHARLPAAANRNVSSETTPSLHASIRQANCRRSWRPPRPHTVQGNRKA